MTVEDLGAELVDDLLVFLAELRFPALGQRGQAVPGDAQAGCLPDVRVPGVLRVEVPGRDEQAQLAQPRVQGRLEPAVRTERLDLLAQLGTAQPDQERPAGAAPAAADPVADFLLAGDRDVRAGSRMVRSSVRSECVDSSQCTGLAAAGRTLRVRAVQAGPG